MTDDIRAARSPRETGRVMLMLIRREYWEHRALWIAPLVVAACVLLGALFGGVNNGEFNPPTAADRHALFGFAIWSFGLPLYITLSIVIWFYAADCLYADRKDRSVLFWKSLPVSDTKTVLSKFLVAVVAAPLLFFAMSVVMNVFVVVIWELRALAGWVPAFWFDAATWLRVEWLSLLWVITGSLWFAPVIAYLMLVSAWARRNVSLWVLIPPLLIMLVELLALRTHYLWNVFKYRFTAHGAQMMGAMSLIGDAVDQSHPAQQSFAQRMFAHLDPTPLLANIDLWLGLAVAAALLYATIRVRRSREEG
jgi:ABC-2 type transport system permease protein